MGVTVRTETDPVLILLFIAIVASLRESLFLDVLFTGIVQFLPAVQLLFPSRFGILLEGQTEQIEVLLPVYSLGLFPVVVKTGYRKVHVPIDGTF